MLIIFSLVFVKTENEYALDFFLLSISKENGNSLVSP
jgi:hypothetical protein